MVWIKFLSIFFILDLKKNYIINAVYITKYFNEQKINHFDYLSEDTFKMKYLEQIHQSYQKNNPIFIYCGNEAPIESFYDNSGFLTQTLFEEFKPFLIFIEHRYFGNSLPFGNKSYENENLKFLTVSQALQDYAYFLNWYLQNQLNCNLLMDACPKIITFGGSYGGMLSAWMRMKFPNIVSGAIASSAPILFFPHISNFQAFSDIITSNYNKSKLKEECVHIIRQCYFELENIKNNEIIDHRINELLQQSFQLCQPIENQENIRQLQDWLSNGFGYMAMINYPYPTNFLQPTPAWPANESCNRLEQFAQFNNSFSNQQNKDEYLKKLFRSILNAVKVYYDYKNEQKCYNLTSSVTQEDMNGWNIISCNQMIMPFNQITSASELLIVSNGKSDFFSPRSFNLSQYTRNCQQIYNQTPNSQWPSIEFGITHTQLQQYSNILFLNGDLDPWHAGSILTNVSESIWAVVMKDAAHHLDLRLPHSQDPESVKKGREIERKFIYQLIN